MRLRLTTKRMTVLKMSIHVDDLLVIGPQDQSGFCLGGWDNALLPRVWKLCAWAQVPGNGALHCSRWITGDNSGYIEGVATMMGVTHAKTPTTPGIRPKQQTEVEEKPVDKTRQRVFRAIV